ncbi:MAG TPA: hypothetical protein DHW71_02375 [Gammaproteobacteria bacterium]|nr:hypothetical protein [Gammaproteobacteria bacterium]HCK91801.1 hypothetical protein [Gammaproteobacteria bacterium]|tara:strand:- start:19923 stop:23288 length:3366 start_codon:yes stop_codon:yes gene_type:complete
MIDLTQNTNDKSNEIQSTLFDELFPKGQVRLSQISLSNWGSFNAPNIYTVNIHENGTLITGDNGAGKSTLIDGLMALLVAPSKASFNAAAAQNSKNDRTLVSYMRGSYGSEGDGLGARVKSKREGAVVTGLRALYEFDDGSCVTLMGLFWIPSNTNKSSDVRRIYMIAKQNLQLKDVLVEFKSMDVRHLKKWIGSHELISEYDQRFGQYQEAYRDLFSMDNPNAPELLQRALGLKRVDDLTELVRTLVLEPCSLKDDAKKVVESFADLNGAYQEMVDAKKQVEHLAPLKEIAAVYDKLSARTAQLLKEKKAFMPFYNKKYAIVLESSLKLIHAHLQQIDVDLKACEGQLAQAKKDVATYRDLYNRAGGDRLQKLKDQIDETVKVLNSLSTNSAEYQLFCDRLNFNNELVKSIFDENQHTCCGLLSKQSDEQFKLNKEMGQNLIAIDSAKETLESLKADLNIIRQQEDSNIDIEFQSIRDWLVGELALAKSECMFVGELIDVNESVKDVWQGAIERALGGIKTTLLITPKDQAKVTNWLNTHDLGLRFKVRVVSDQWNFKQRKSKENGFVQHLKWKEHAFAPWLQKMVAQYDLTCVASTAELDATPFSLTKEGLVHLEQGKFEKNDRDACQDKRKWCLGFSNKDRVLMLEAECEQVNATLQGLLKQEQDLNDKSKEFRNNEKALEKIQDFKWDDINIKPIQEKYALLQEELQLLETKSTELQDSKRSLERAENNQNGLEDEKTRLNVLYGMKKKESEDVQSKLENTLKQAAVDIDEATEESLEKRFGVITLESDEQKEQVKSKLDSEHDAALNKLHVAEKKATRVITAFKSNERWKLHTLEWPVDLAAMSDCLAHLETIEKEGLPSLETRFKNKLNNDVTQPLANLFNEYKHVQEEIHERIERINQVLQRTDYNPSCYLLLETKKEHHPHVREFFSQLQQCLSLAVSQDQDLRFAALKSVIDILDEACKSNSLNHVRLLDPRYQLSFVAKLINKDTHEEVDSLGSSSGKSGGEKESFAGVIVAASLAYVLTPDGHDKPVYKSVFLDEAFSNTQESNSRRVLKVFKELSLQTNLLTPYKNLNLAREFAQSLLIVSRNPELHQTSVDEASWTEVESIINSRGDS